MGPNQVLVSLLCLAVAPVGSQQSEVAERPELSSRGGTVTVQYCMS